MAKRKAEIFSAGCGVCEETVQLVRRIACSSCDVSAVDMKDPKIAERARDLGVRSVPAIAVNGKLVTCCAGRGPDEAALRAAGIGQPM
jgi:hypothetical protein